VSGQLHAPAALPPGKSPRYPFYRRLGGPQSRSGRYGEVNISYPTGIRTLAPPGRPARSQSLYRLSYLGSQNWQEKRKYSVKPLSPKYHYVLNRSHITWHGIELRPPWDIYGDKYDLITWTRNSTDNLKVSLPQVICGLFCDAVGMSEYLAAEQWNYLWMINWKWFGRKWSCPTLDTIPKYREKIRVTYVPAEIRTVHLRNTS
jgi:hypothetical protein